MNRFRLFAAAAVSVLLGAVPVSAQQRVFNPNLSLSSPGSSPVQQQMREDYRTQLQGAQRGLQQSNPSDLSREQQQIGQQLNNYSNMGPR